MKSECIPTPSCLITNYYRNNTAKTYSTREGLCSTVITYYKCNNRINNVTTNNVVTYTLFSQSGSYGKTLSPTNRNNGDTFVIINTPSRNSLYSAGCISGVLSS